MCRWVRGWARGQLLHCLPSVGGGCLRCAHRHRARVEVRSGVFQFRSSRGAESPGLHCVTPVDFEWLGGRAGHPSTPVIVCVRAVLAPAARACSWRQATGVRPRCDSSICEVFAVGDPEPAQGLADSAHAGWRMPLLGQQGPYFDVRRASRSLEPCGVAVVSIAGQEFLDGLGEGLLQLRRSASPAPRAGWPVVAGRAL